MATAGVIDVPAEVRSERTEVRADIDEAALDTLSTSQAQVLAEIDRGLAQHEQAIKGRFQ